MSTLKGQTILIFGGSSGIGYGVALACLRSFASKVIIASSSQEKLVIAAKRLHAAIADYWRIEGLHKLEGLEPGVIETRVVDCRDLKSVKIVTEEVGEIDHLVFCAGDHLRVVDFKITDVGTMKGSSVSNLGWPRIDELMGLS